MRTAVQRAGTKAIGRSRNAATRRSEQGQWLFTSVGRSGSAAIAATAASKESSCSPISALDQRRSDFLSSVSPLPCSSMILPSVGKKNDVSYPNQKEKKKKKSKFPRMCIRLRSNRLTIKLCFCPFSAAIVSSLLGLGIEIVHGFCHRIPADVAGTEPLVEKISHARQRL
jgi:hypothetical protein